MSKVKLALIMLLILVSIETYNIKKTRNIFEGVGNISQITLYNIDSKESVHIQNTEYINYYISMFNKIKFNKEKIVGNSSIKGLIVILYDEDGMTKDTLYLSKDTLIQNHRKLKVIDGENPYNELMEVLESRLLKNIL